MAPLHGARRSALTQANNVCRNTKKQNIHILRVKACREFLWIYIENNRPAL